jgi:hypothetical protein
MSGGFSGDRLVHRGKDAGSLDWFLGAAEDATVGEPPSGSCRTCGWVYY